MSMSLNSPNLNSSGHKVKSLRLIPSSQYSEAVFNKICHSNLSVV